MRPIPLSAAALVLSVAIASAQGARKVAFRTLCPEPLPGVTELWLPAATPKGEAVSVPLYAGAPSQVVEGNFKGDDAVFFAIAPDPAAKTAPTPAARGKLGKSKRQLLVFLPSTAGEGAPDYEIRAFDDDTTDFKLGSVRAINLSPQPVRFTMAEVTLPAIPASEHAQFPAPKKADEYGMYAVSVELQEDGGNWRQVYSASWKTSDRRREIVFVQIDGKSKLPMVKLVNDDPPWLDQK